MSLCCLEVARGHLRTGNTTISSCRLAAPLNACFCIKVMTALSLELFLNAISAHEIFKTGA